VAGCSDTTKNATLSSSKRYADHFDKVATNRATERAMSTGEPESLSPLELQLGMEPLTRAPIPRQVRAWVRYGNEPVFVDAVAIAWTEHAVAIKWPTPNGEHHAWVWGSAVRGR
jgi:hypothetical protein